MAIQRSPKRSKKKAQLAENWVPNTIFDVIAPTALANLGDDGPRIAWYVNKVCEANNLKITKNRGVPPRADPDQMLTLEEKAICFLGKALGATSLEVLDRINDGRATKGLPEIATRNSRMHQLTNRNRKLVAAIQADILVHVEQQAPLINGTNRFLWRARILELYKKAAVAAANSEHLTGAEKIREIAKFDKLMRPHMEWFDRIGESGDLAAKLASPSESLAEQQQQVAKDDLRRRHEEGEITEEEMMDQLREIRDLAGT